MKEVTFANHMISIVLMAALGASMAPAVAIAAEDGADGDVQGAASQVDAQSANEAAVMADGVAASEETEVADANVAPVSATAVVTDDGASAAPAMVSASAALSTSDPVVLMTQGDTTLAVDVAQGAAVAVGIAKTAEGELSIPQNVTVAGKEIPVVGIDLRGGASPICQKWG